MEVNLISIKALINTQMSSNNKYIIAICLFWKIQERLFHKMGLSKRLKIKFAKSVEIKLTFYSQRMKLSDK